MPAFISNTTFFGFMKLIVADFKTFSYRAFEN
jgi:hypothetical protein